MMAGWITRVVTVTHGPRYLRVSAYVPPRYVEVRAPTAQDLPGVSAWIPMRAREFSGGPCGTAAREASARVWAWTIAELHDYITRWGSNPLGAAQRLGAGAKQGKRGRGPQDYIK